MTPVDSPLTVLTSLLLRSALPETIPATAASLVSLARINVVLIRLQEKVERCGFGASWTELRAAAAEDRIRVRRCTELMQEVTAICDRAGIPHVFQKAFQHYPDMGHDVDLLVKGSAGDVDRPLLDGLQARRTAPGLFDRIAGKTGMWRDDWAAPIEVHHARLGQVGEQVGLAAEVLANRRQVSIDGLLTWIPSPEDEVLIQAHQRVCCHLSLRVSDVIKGAALVADRAKNWEHIWDTAARCGVDGAVRVYVGHIARITESVGESASSTVPMRNGRYTVALSDVALAYGAEIRTLLARAEWNGLMRLSAAPLGFALARSLAVARAVKLSRHETN